MHGYLLFDCPEVRVARAEIEAIGRVKHFKALKGADLGSWGLEGNPKGTQSETMGQVHLAPLSCMIARTRTRRLSAYTATTCMIRGSGLVDVMDAAG